MGIYSDTREISWTTVVACVATIMLDDKLGEVSGRGLKDRGVHG